jgi:hypothetical protein
MTQTGQLRHRAGSVDRGRIPAPGGRRERGA